MLVLKRRRGEAIDIAGVKVFVLEFSPSFVKLGVEAPEGVEVLRSELVGQPKKPKE